MDSIRRGVTITGTQTIIRMNIEDWICIRN